LPSPPPPEPLLHKQETQDYVSDNDSKTKQPAPGLSRAGDEKAEGKKVSPDQPGMSSSGSDGDDLEDDSEMDEMLRALSESSSSDDDKDDDHGQPRLQPGGRTPNTFSRNGPASNIALLMVACWTLRLPIMYLDLIRLGRSMVLTDVCGVVDTPSGRSSPMTSPTWSHYAICPTAWSAT
jgi:RNA polymerase I-specific transcription initiation factor RRN7